MRKITHIGEAAEDGSVLQAAARTERFLRELADAVARGEVTGVALTAYGPRRGVETFWQTLGSGRVTGITLLGGISLVESELSRHLEKQAL